MKFTTLAYLSLVALILLGCGGEPGRVHAEKRELVGTYEAELKKGSETLELRQDNSYLQSFTGDEKRPQHSGTWKVEDHFLAGTDVVLLGAMVFEDDPPGSPGRVGDRTLNVHKRSGKVALAINEVADWYFIRTN